MGVNTFIITFKTHADKLKVMDGRPWLFDSHMFILQVFDGFSQPQHWKFDREVFWIQFHNLPMAYMTRDCGVQIGNSTGKVLDVEVIDDGVGWGQFLRVKIEISLLRAIARGKFIKTNGRNAWINFKYLKLP